MCIVQEETTLNTEDRIRVSIKEAARLLSISKRMVEYRISEKELTTVRDARRVLLLMSELRRYARANHYSSPRKKRQK